MKPVSRRNFLKLFASSLLLLSIKKAEADSQILKKLFNSKKDLSFRLIDSPIQESNGNSSINFNGDNIELPHDILWNVDGFIKKMGGIPTPSESFNFVVVGGGMSGLLTSYRLRKMKPLLLEQDHLFGGNSKGEKFGGSIYSIGAAYVTVPGEGDQFDLFFKELGLYKKFRHETDKENLYLFQKKLNHDFWKGDSVNDLQRKSDFLRVEEKLRYIKEKAFPDIPWSEESQITLSEYKRLDSISFQTWLNETFGELHEHIYEYFQKYCWSSFTGSIDELSALQVLNFVASEVDGVLALPGGNSFIAQTLFEKLNSTLGKNFLRSNSFVVNIEERSGGVWVTYFDNVNKSLVTILAKKVVVASPKFVARRIVKNIPKAQEKLMDDVRYRGYIVTNVFLKNKIKSPSFDVFSIDGVMPDSPSGMRPPKCYMTDVCFGSWAQNGKEESTVLTMYRPLAFDGARQFLFAPFAHEKHLKKSKEEIKDFLKALNLDESDVASYRLTRWGHSLPVADIGFLANDLDKKMNAPINGKIFFVNQDNYVNPAFETAFQAVLDLEKSLKN